MSKLLEVKNLKTSFRTHIGDVQAVRGVSLYLDKGEALGIVGESGCGKSVTMMSIMRLLADNAVIESDKIIFDGEDITNPTENQMQEIRGNEMAMIFQDPMTSLNPLFTVGDQLTEHLIKHKKISKKEANELAIKMLDMVGIPSPESRLKQYPHEFSGGMRQRVMIAMSLICEPKLIIADEPTTALDVTIQAQILDLMRDIKEKMDTAILLITHDLGVVAEMADYVVVMYAGKVIEEGPVNAIFSNPSHPYTVGLLKSKPILNQYQDRLYSIPGQVPSPIGMPENCYFSERCEFCFDKCKSGQPGLKLIEDGHKVACFKYEGE